MNTYDLQKKAIAEAAARFERETTGHTMAVLHEDGLYRHLRFSDPESPFCWFDLVTWPGTLAIKGGMGTFMFSREKDMFVFFRGRTGAVNPGYWAEKLPGGRDSAREYDESILRAELEEALAEHEREYLNLLSRYFELKATYDALPQNERWPFATRGMREPVEPKTADEVRELISDYDDDGQLSYESGARDLLAELENAGVVSDTFEWNLHEYTVFFLWCCHAIQWGIGQYDAAKAQPEASATQPPPTKAEAASYQPNYTGCGCAPNPGGLHLKACPVWINIGPNLIRAKYVRRDSEEAGA